LVFITRNNPLSDLVVIPIHVLACGLYFLVFVSAVLELVPVSCSSQTTKHLLVYDPHPCDARCGRSQASNALLTV